MKEYRVIGMRYDMPYAEARDRFIRLANYLSLPEDNINTTLFVLKIEYGGDSYKSIKAAAEKFGFEAYEHTYKMEYTAKELSEANFFEVTFRIYGREDYTESYQTEYSDFYCESCNTHQLVPEGEIYINKTEFRGKDIAVSLKMNNEIIVSDKMKGLIESAGLTGVEFFPAHHYNNRSKNNYPVWRMGVKSVMPPISREMPVYIMESYCDVCKKHHILPLSYARYMESELLKVSDLNLSCETYGNGWYGSPKLIVSRRFYDLIKENKIKGCKFEIVGIV